MVIAGGQENLSKNLADELRVATSDENKDGSRIKVIIGSKVASEGLDFKCVRSIHILEPWHNINRLEQVIGRGVRNCSHKELSPEQRNVTIYLHNAFMNQGHETIDTYLYRYSERKAKEIGVIEMILKRGAIDKYLFKNLNKLTKYDVESFKVKPAFRKSRLRIYSYKDEPYSRVCSFQPESECDYIDDMISLKDLKESDMNDDTFRMEYSQGFIDVYKKRISLLLQENICIHLSELKPMIEVYQEVHDIFLNGAVDQMINERDPIFGPTGDKGYAIINDEYLIFQPDFSTDTLLPYYYRLNQGSLKPKVPSMDSVVVRKTLIDTEDIECTQGAKDILLIIKEYSLNPNETYIYKLCKLPKSVQWEYIIDRLPFNQRKLVFGIASALFMGDISTDSFGADMTDLVKCIGDIGKRSFIYYDKNEDKYSYGTESKKLFYGYLLYHTSNEEMYSFSYKEGIISITDHTEQIELERQIQQYKTLVMFTGVSWGYLIYVKRYDGVVCKIVGVTDTIRKKYSYPSLSGPGSIFRDPKPVDPYVSIEKEFPEFLKKLKAQDIISLRQDKSSRIKYAVMIECALRMKHRLLSQEMAYLRYLI